MKAKQLISRFGRDRMARLVLEIGIVSEDLMERFSGAGKKKKE